jgi:Tfp pilus assembly protein PilF
MQKLLTFIIFIYPLTTFGQQMTSSQWEEQSKTNIRLLPKYGHIQKNENQKKADKEFIETALKQDSTNRKASDHLVRLGFSYLYRDIKTAMYRFNQAYLLDSTNTDIYWGYGGVYMTLGEYAKAEKQYLEGLALNPSNTHLLTDYGTYFMAQYYNLQPIDEKGALRNLDSAIMYMTKSYQFDPLDQNTSFKLSICYWNKGDCDNAWKYYDLCKALGGQPITEDYTNDLQRKCKREK